MFRSSGLFHGLFLWQKMKYEVLIAMSMVFIIIIIITLYDVGAKHSYVTIKYNEANLSQLLKTTKPQRVKSQ